MGLWDYVTGPDGEFNWADLFGKGALESSFDAVTKPGRSVPPGTDPTPTTPYTPEDYYASQPQPSVFDKLLGYGQSTTDNVAATAKAVAVCFVVIGVVYLVAVISPSIPRKAV